MSYGMISILLIGSLRSPPSIQGTDQPVLKVESLIKR